MFPAVHYAKKYRISCCSCTMLVYVLFGLLAIVLPYLIAYWNLGK